MTEQPAGPSKGAATRRRPTGSRRFVVFVIGMLAAAAIALALVPAWLPLIPGSDGALIHYERAQRRLRYEFGLPMPGEPDLARYSQRLAESGFAQSAPILIRIFKREFELEIWMQRDGVFRRFATYPICLWSGRLGPKLQQGDRQTPEGFYTVDATSLNPNSRYYRSFNLGYPNAFDRAKNRTGSLIMVHGGCASIGCFAMTNAQMGEIWQLVTAALAGGQKRFQVQVYPFRMSGSRLAERASDPDVPFWKDLKAGSDLFEARQLPPVVSVCEGRYRFEAGEPGSTGDRPIEDRCPAGTPKS
jgi:murein L,D-transpeptidase YafK